MNDDRADGFLRKIYELYADYALKNPFYSLEMPIRAGLLLFILFWKEKLIFLEKFDEQVKTIVEMLDKPI